MATIKNNTNSLITIRYVGGSKSRCDFFPGINLNVPAEEWSAIKKHPLVQRYLEESILDSLTREPSSKGTGEMGLELTDDKKTDEPLPISEAKISEPAKEEKSTRRRRKKTDEDE